jgi:ERCC4-related helicase
MDDSKIPQPPATNSFPATRGYQQEMLEGSLAKNLIIALDTCSGKTHNPILRMKIEAEREAKKVICSPKYFTTTIYV